MKPVAGNFAFALFSIGLIGTGMLSIPVLAGSAAYAASECCGWACSLESRPKEAVGFYSVIAIATVLGLSIEFLPVDPIRALFWSAVINGFVAVPIMIGMMMVVSRHARMKQFTARPTLVAAGGSATAVMAAAAAAMMIYW